MGKQNRREVAREKRHTRVRVRVQGTAERPRLNVFRSLRHIYAQIIDDGVGHSLVSASTLDAEVNQQLDKPAAESKPSAQKLTKTDQAKLVGKVLAKRALDKGLKQVVFDRGGYRYHGRVKALAEGARSEGLQF